MRDEAHRFAVTYHRKVRSRRTIATALTGIDGVGPRRAKLLLKRFGSLKGVRDASLPSLAEAVGPRLAERIRASLQGTAA
ncbi:MAG: helix-hairpin-helix domain-containing protein [Acidobacteria bacterium]|nr:helix-hairpin-helix domain-containing protein [Acidobacteriota bacterium]